MSLVREAETGRLDGGLRTRGGLEAGARISERIEW